MSLTTAVRAELASTPLPDGTAGRAELAGMLRFSGVLHRQGGDHEWAWLSTLRSTAARRADRQLVRLFATRCALRARQVTAPRPMLLVELEIPPALLTPLGLDPQTPGIPRWVRASEGASWAYVRGVAQACLRLANPARPHCEMQAPNETLARDLAALLRDLGVHAAARRHSRDRWRVVAKSRAAIGTLLAGTGASDAYLQWEDESARRSVRGAAARGVNADRANARRSVQAASRHVAMVVDALGRLDLDDLPEELRSTALARLANPAASLGELATLLDVSKATVSRRLRRLAAAADGAPGSDGSTH